MKKIMIDVTPRRIFHWCRIKTTKDSGDKVIMRNRLKDFRKTGWKLDIVETGVHLPSFIMTGRCETLLKNSC